MRYALIALGALTASALGASALALNPQPLPPGIYAPGQSKAAVAEPPDPCLGVQGVAHARCVQRHQHLSKSRSHHVPSGVVRALP